MEQSDLNLALVSPLPILVFTESAHTPAAELPVKIPIQESIFKVTSPHLEGLQIPVYQLKSQSQVLQHASL